jgi:hypothetical protein
MDKRWQNYAWLVGSLLIGACCAQVVYMHYQEAERSRAKSRPPRKWSELNFISEALDNVDHSERLDTRKEDIKEGIEGCIGNTPLIKIKSLSEATGCEILAKAEVSKVMNATFRNLTDDCWS